MTVKTLTCAVVLVAVTTTAQAALIAGWNFNDGNLGVDHGAGTITAGGLTAALFLPVGSGINLQGSDTAGSSLTYAVAGANNGGTLTLQFSTVGLGAPILTYSVGSLVNGFTGVQWSYSTNGSSYTNFGSSLGIPTITTTVDLSLMQLHTVNLTSLGGSLAGQSSVYLRGTFTGITSLVAANLVMDNIQITAIPEPSAHAMFAAGAGLGLALLRRRRRGV